MKADKATIRKRVEEFLRLRLEGKEMPDLAQHADEQGWNVSIRQLWRYAAASDKLLAQSLEKDRQKILNRHIAERRHLYAKAVAAADYGTASRILKDLAELLNLYPPKRSEVSGFNG